jgi:hypothetical protein
MDRQAKETYLDYKNHLIEARHQSYQQFDKAIFLLSGGGLTVSLALVDRIVPLAQAQSKIFLFICWICFTIPLILTLISFVFSQRSIDFQIKMAHDYYVSDCDDAINQRNWWSFLTQYFNYASGSFFIIGVILLLIFVYMNIV